MRFERALLSMAAPQQQPSKGQGWGRERAAVSGEEPAPRRAVLPQRQVEVEKFLYCLGGPWVAGRRPVDERVQGTHRFALVLEYV